MGKSSKKSATKLDEDEEAAPPPPTAAAEAEVVLVSNSGKKRKKREAENEIDIETDNNTVIAKKQKKEKKQKKKKDVAVVEPISKTEDPEPKALKKKKKKKVEENSSSEEDEKLVAAEKPVVVAKKVESRSFKESSSDESEKENTPAKVTAKKAEASSSTEESDSKEESKKVAEVSSKTVKNGSSSQKDIADERISEEDEPAKTPKNKPAMAATLCVSSSKNLFICNLSFRVKQSDVEELFNECGEVDVSFATDKDGRHKGFAFVEFATAEQAKEALKLNGANLAGLPVRLELALEKGEKSAQGQYIQEFDTSKGEDKPSTTATPDVISSTNLFVGNLSYRIEQSDVAEFFNDCGEVVDVRFGTGQDGRFKGYGHVEFATAEQAKKALQLNGADLAGRPVRLDLAPERGEKGAQGQPQRVFVRRDDTSEREDKKKDTDVEMVDAESKSGKKALATPAPLVIYSSKTLFAGNLSFRIEQSDVVEFFKECGEVVDVRFATDEDGQFKGFGHIKFATAEQAKKAFELNGADLAGRPVRLELARERRDKSAQGQSARGFDTFEVVDKLATAAKPREPPGDNNSGVRCGRDRSEGRGRGGGGRHDICAPNYYHYIYKPLY